MEVKKMSLANIRGKLSRDEMSRILAGDVPDECDDDLRPLCIPCSTDSQCTINKVCRYSPSCSEPKVCARPLIC